LGFLFEDVKRDHAVPYRPTVMSIGAYLLGSFIVAISLSLQLLLHYFSFWRSVFPRRTK
jgi:hypothetical protein